jgi:hypothetical protein
MLPARFDRHAFICKQVAMRHLRIVAPGGALMIFPLIKKGRIASASFLGSFEMLDDVTPLKELLPVFRESHQYG